MFDEKGGRVMDAKDRKIAELGDLKARIAELEGKLDLSNKLLVEYTRRFHAAEAKLARVKAWASTVHTVDSDPISVILHIADEMGRLAAILSDTSQPLAVVDGWYAPGDDFPVRISDYGVDNEVPVTVIIMPKEATDGD